MSNPRITWIAGKMFFPDDIDPAFIDWVEPLNPETSTETEHKKEEEIQCK